ncbi:MAG: hypothetical protein ABI665_03775 [Vicinamibacterales bacterium]
MSFIDTFDRVGPDPGASWETVAGSAWVIASSLYLKPSSTYAYTGIRAVGTFPSDQYAEAVIRMPSGAGDSSYAGVAVRMGPSGDCYKVRVLPTAIAVYKHLSGVDVYLADVAAALALDTDYTIRITVAGITLTVRLNAALVLTATDVSLSEGNPGFHALTGQTSLFPRFDNFESTSPGVIDPGGGQPGDGSTANTTRDIITLPPLLPMSVLGAGFKFTDPIFRSRMLRVTDGGVLATALNASYRTTSSSPSRGWNAASTKFFIVNTQGTVLPYAFDASTMTASRIAGSGDGGLVLAFNTEPEFSRNNADLIYGGWVRGAGSEATVRSYNFATNTYTEILGVRDLVPTVDAGGRTYLRGISSGSNGSSEFLAFTFGGVAQDADHYIAYWPAGNLGAMKLMDTQASTINGVAMGTTLGWNVHNIQMDQSGRFIIITKQNDSVTWVWDTNGNTVSHNTVDGGGHEAAGWQALVNNANNSDSAEWQYRSLFAPMTTRELVTPYPTISAFGTASHANWNNANATGDQPLFAGLYRYNHDAYAWREWDDEIIGIRTDGLQVTVWRYCHHRSDCSVFGAGDPAHVNAFYYTPRPNVSPDGKFLIFTSNWGFSLGDDPFEWGPNKRQDVFMVELGYGELVHGPGPLAIPAPF